MIIAVDAMGGDHAPDAITEGVSLALERYSEVEKILLVGDRQRVEASCRKFDISDHPKVEYVQASQVVEMHEASTLAIRGKKDSSITVSANLAKEGRCQAIVSAGHTGAAVAASVVRMRTLEGVERPGIATVFPTPAGQFVLVDAGANVDSSPKNLVQFGIMGEIYARRILGIENPRVGLLSNGEEASKGTEVVKGTHKLLKEIPFNFIGNVEGRDLFEGNVDVVICDGFVGNVVLKTSESLAKGFGKILKELLTKNPKRMAGAFLAKGAFDEMKKIGDYAEYGGAPLLGVNGICIIGHGSSSPKAVMNAIRVACEFIRHEVNSEIVERVKETNL